MGKNKVQKQNGPRTYGRKKKSQKTQVPQPIQNIISIKKLNNQKQIVADFPLIRVGNSRQVMSIPVFRKDKLDFTPGFCLPDQFTPQFINEQQVLQQYRISSEITSVDVENIKQPKPSSRNSYCTICKVRFEDYKQHTDQPDHNTRMGNSLYNKLIEELCNQKRLERFLANAIAREETSAQERTYNDQKIFHEEQPPKIEKKISGDSKQALYAIVQGEKPYKQKPLGPLQQNIVSDHVFDVLF